MKTKFNKEDIREIVELMDKYGEDDPAIREHILNLFTVNHPFKVIQRRISVVIIKVWVIIVVSVLAARFLFGDHNAVDILSQELLVYPATLVLSLYFGGGLMESTSFGNRRRSKYGRRRMPRKPASRPPKRYYPEIEEGVDFEVDRRDLNHREDFVVTDVDYEELRKRKVREMVDQEVGQVTDKYLSRRRGDERNS